MTPTSRPTTRVRTTAQTELGAISRPRAAAPTEPEKGRQGAPFPTRQALALRGASHSRLAGPFSAAPSCYRPRTASPQAIENRPVDGASGNWRADRRADYLERQKCLQMANSSGGLENRYGSLGSSRVQIPPPPLRRAEPAP